MLIIEHSHASHSHVYHLHLPLYLNDNLCFLNCVKDEDGAKMRPQLCTALTLFEMCHKIASTRARKNVFPHKSEIEDCETSTSTHLQPASLPTHQVSMLVELHVGGAHLPPLPRPSIANKIKQQENLCSKNKEMLQMSRR